MKPTTPPAFLYFDLGNVLLLFDHDIACRQIGQLTGLSSDQVRDTVFESDLNHRYECGQITSRQFYEEFCAATGARPDFDAFLVAGSDIFTLNLPMMPVVAQLNAAGYPIGILSNTCEAHWQYITGGRFAVLNDFFRLHVLSFEERCSKPDKALYLKAAERAGVAPAEVFYVDDRPENVAGAIRAGFDAVVFEGARQLAAALRERGLRFNY